MKYPEILLNVTVTPQEAVAEPDPGHVEFEFRKIGNKLTLKVTSSLIMNCSGRNTKE